MLGRLGYEVTSTTRTITLLRNTAPALLDADVLKLLAFAAEQAEPPLTTASPDK
jgi:NAD(P)H-hydrate repair Nnr-like enzyme with NAD(P)H-hydrate dehydratase domain